MANENIQRRAFVVGSMGISLVGCLSLGPQEDEQAEATGENEDGESPNRTEPSDAEKEGPPEESENESEGETTHTLTVRLEGESGSMVDGTVVIRGPDGRRLFESSNSEAVMDVQPGDYTISAANYDAGVGSGEQNVRVYEDTEVVLTLVEMVVETVTVIAGPEKTMATPGVDVTVERWDGATTTKTTGEDGTVEFNLYQGRYEITAVDDSGTQETKVVPVYRSEEVEFEDFGSYENVPMRTVVFEVENALDEPLSGIIIKGRATNIMGVYSEEEFDDDVDFESNPTDENGNATAEARESHKYEVWGVDAQTGEYYEPDSVHSGNRSGMVVYGDTEVRVSFFDLET